MRHATLCGLLLMLGCGPSGASDGGDGDDGDDSVDAGDTERADARTPVIRPDAAVDQACDQMDILFVIDNSGSMDQEQTNLAANFPQFVSVLEAFTNDSGQTIDYHVGVTTTGVSKDIESVLIPGLPAITEHLDGEDGHLQVGDCGMPRKWLERGDADVSGHFACIANVGIGGSSEEMPLEGARLALTERMVANENLGFVREDALLAIVLLTDEQDCSFTEDMVQLDLGDNLCSSATEVASYVSAIDAVKGSRDRWATAVIAGVDPEPCSSELGSADAATRLVDFAGQAGPNAVTSSICNGDLAAALGQAMATFQAACNSIGDPVE